MKIKYKFATGDVTEVEVSEEIGAVIIDSRRKEHADNERHRYHTAFSINAAKCEDKDYFSANGDLELAMIPESFRTDALKEELDANGVLIENAQMQLASFALLFEFDSDIKHIRHVLYNCAASRPGIEGKTNENSREVQTETLTIKATPLANGMVKAKTGNTTSAEAYNNWYKAVYMPVTESVDATPVDADCNGEG